MITNDNVLYAIELATYWHDLQKDKSGNLYLLHPFYVMLQMEENDERVVAVLHDTVEDTDLTLKLLRDTEAFPDYVVDAIDAITKRKGEKKEAYWARVKANPLALRVKLADIAHNSSEARLVKLPKEEQEYLRDKYKKAKEFLTSLRTSDKM